MEAYVPSSSPGDIDCICIDSVSGVSVLGQFPIVQNHYHRRRRRRHRVCFAVTVLLETQRDWEVDLVEVAKVGGQHSPSHRYMSFSV